MPELKNFYIKILGTKIVKNEQATKVARLVGCEELKDHKAEHWNMAHDYAEKKALMLLEQHAWDDFDVTVVESVPHVTAVYNMHYEEIKKFVGSFFNTYWDSIIQNPVLLMSKDKLENNGHKLLVDILISFLKSHCPEYVSYKKEIRKDEVEDFEKALKNYLVFYFQCFGYESEAYQKNAG